RAANNEATPRSGARGRSGAADGRVASHRGVHEVHRAGGLDSPTGSITAGSVPVVGTTERRGLTAVPAGGRVAVDRAVYDVGASGDAAAERVTSRIARAALRGVTKESAVASDGRVPRHRALHNRQRSAICDPAP